MDVGKAVQIGLLGLVVYLLLQVVPVVPKAIQFMDDVHYVRTTAEPRWHKTAEQGVSTLTSIKDKFSFLEDGRRPVRLTPAAISPYHGQQPAAPRPVGDPPAVEASPDQDVWTRD